MWIQCKPPTVPSLENFPSMFAKRFTSICITHLIMHRQSWIKRKMQELGIDTPQKAIEFVIINIDYPFTRGMPDDKHIYNAFSGKACYTIIEDYWATAYEVLMTYVLNKKLYGKHGYGDCEDTSLLITSLLRNLNIPAYEVFGTVYRDNQLLGGHGWLIAQLPEDNKWHLIESTLDVPPQYPDGYPEVNPDSNIWTVGSITYKAMFKFNESEFYMWGKSVKEDQFTQYLKFRRRDKERYVKYKAIEEAWRIRVKPLKKRRILGKLRWR